MGLLQFAIPHLFARSCLEKRDRGPAKQRHNHPQILPDETRIDDLAATKERGRNTTRAAERLAEAGRSLPADLTREAWYNIWVAVLGWRQSRKTPPKCLCDRDGRDMIAGGNSMSTANELLSQALSLPEAERAALARQQ